MTDDRYEVDVQALLAESQQVLSFLSRGLLLNARVEYVDDVIEFEPNSDWVWTLRSERITDEVREAVRSCYGLELIFFYKNEVIPVPAGRVDDDLML